MKFVKNICTIKDIKLFIIEIKKRINFAVDLVADKYSISKIQPEKIQLDTNIFNAVALKLKKLRKAEKYQNREKEWNKNQNGRQKFMKELLELIRGLLKSGDLSNIMGRYIIK